MGIFGNDASNPRADSLAANAVGESVTADRLVKTESGIMQKDFLADDPILTHLTENEQPQYFFFNDNKGISRNESTTGGGHDADYRSLCVVTDQRVLYCTGGTRGEALPFGAITHVETNTGHMKHRLTINTASDEYTFYVSNTIDGAEVVDGGEYIESRAADVSDMTNSEPTQIEGMRSIWDDQIDGSPDADDALDADPQGSYVTKKRYEKVKGILDPGETVHFITRGSTVDVEGSSAGSSLFGDDRSRKSGTRGWVRAVITDKRVAIKIPQVLGTDERSVPYSSLTSVDLDTGLVTKRLTLQTAGQTYHIEAHDPGKDEVRRAVRFIRQKTADAEQPDVIQQQPTESEPDPLERIEKLQDLKDAGAISEAEFEEKKQDLLDQV